MSNLFFYLFSIFQILREFFNGVRTRVLSARQDLIQIFAEQDFTQVNWQNITLVFTTLCVLIIFSVNVTVSLIFTMAQICRIVFTIILLIGFKIFIILKFTSQIIASGFTKFQIAAKWSIDKIYAKFSPNRPINNLSDDEDDNPVENLPQNWLKTPSVSKIFILRTLFRYFRSQCLHINVQLAAYLTKNKIDKRQRQILATSLMTILLIHREQLRFYILGTDPTSEDSIYLSTRLIWRLVTDYFRTQIADPLEAPSEYKITLYTESKNYVYNIGDPCAIPQYFYENRIGPINPRNTELEKIFITQIHAIRRAVLEFQYLYDDHLFRHVRKSGPLVPLENLEIDPVKEKPKKSKKLAGK